MNHYTPLGIDLEQFCNLQLLQLEPFEMRYDI